MPTVESGMLNINLRGTEAQEAFLNPIFFDEGLEELFDMMVLVNSEQKIAYVGTLENILKSSTGCGFNPSGSFNISERCISTREVSAELELCYDEFKNTLYLQKAKAGVNRGDLMGTLFADLLQTRVSQGIRKDMIRAAWFGDQTSIDPNVNYVDGMWSVYIPDLVAANLIPKINSNSGVPLGAGDGIDLLEAVYNGATNFLKATANMDKVMYVSANVYEQYMADLENSGQSSAAHLMMIRNGEMSLTYRGVEVKPMYEWQAYADTYLGLADANLVLYTTKKNFVMATDIANVNNQVKMWYDEREETLCVRVKFYLGFNFKHPEFLTVAY